MNIQATVTDLKQTSIAQVIRNFALFVSFMTPIYFFLGPIIKPYAQEAFVQALDDAGASPSAIAKIIDKVGQIDKSTENLTSDISKVKKQNEELLAQQDQMQRENTDTKRMVEKLLNLQLGIHQ